MIGDWVYEASFGSVDPVPQDIIDKEMLDHITEMEKHETEEELHRCIVCHDTTVTGSMFCGQDCANIHSMNQMREAV